MRTTIVSTSKLKSYRRIVFVVDVIFLLAMLTLVWSLFNEGANWVSMAVPVIVYFQFHMYFPMFLKLRNVSYVESSVYFSKNGYEVQVPFEDILSIEIKSITGIYAIILAKPAQAEQQIYFKASAWYPFNFQKKDEVVNELRDKIDQYQRTLPEKKLTVLPSYNL